MPKLPAFTLHVRENGQTTRRIGYWHAQQAFRAYQALERFSTKDEPVWYSHDLDTANAWASEATLPAWQERLVALGFEEATDAK